MQVTCSDAYRTSYDLFKRIGKTNCTFSVTLIDATLVTKVIKRVDQGAQKVLYMIQENLILFTPNLNCFDPIRDAEEIARDAIPPTVFEWNIIVNEELRFGNKAKSLGLLNSECNQCKLSLDGATAVAYTAHSFESMANRGLHVVENGFKTCTWIQRNLFLFLTDDERKSLACWETRISDLINDVVQVCKNGMPIGVDSLHTALYRQTDDAVYNIRYFGFDFYTSDKATVDYAPYIFKTLIEPIVKLEFRNLKYDTTELIISLNEKCMSLFKTRIGH